MQSNRWFFAAAIAFSLSWLPAANAEGQNPPNMQASVTPPVIIPVDSPAVVFSPGNWTGDMGRGGSLYRQSWNAGAYFRVYWSSASANPTATLLFDTSTLDLSYAPPELTLNVDGIWKGRVPCASEINIAHLTGAGNHVLTVYIANSAQRDHWGSDKTSGKNVVRVKGLLLDDQSKAGTAILGTQWALEIGDSITEGIGADVGRADNLSSYSYFIGQALQSRGMEYGVSACGWNGWLQSGDDPPHDVPAYYMVTGSTNGAGGVYDDAASRWNKLDASHSFLDTRGRLSAHGAHGATGQEPSIITINYGTNDIFRNSNSSDLRASVTQSVASLRAAAPEALIFVIIPFGQFAAESIETGVQACSTAHPNERKVILIDLGHAVAQGLGTGDYWGGLHPNQRGHAVFAARILAVIERHLNTP
jgi:hypothetical protein